MDSYILNTGVYFSEGKAFFRHPFPFSLSLLLSSVLVSLVIIGCLRDLGLFVQVLLGFSGGRMRRWIGKVVYLILIRYYLPIKVSIHHLLVMYLLSVRCMLLSFLLLGSLCCRISGVGLALKFSWLKHILFEVVNLVVKQ